MFCWTDEFGVLQTRLLRAFALRYLLLDNAFHTVELGYTDRFVLVNNTFIRPGHFPPFQPTDDMDTRRVKAM